jgi:hypothetical protein
VVRVEEEIKEETPIVVKKRPGRKPKET